MSERLEFNFELMGLDELLTVWTDHAHLLGGLFWLSYGSYWMVVDGELVPTTHPDLLNRYPQIRQPVGIDYQVLRFFADIGEVLVPWLTPVPASLADALASGAWQHWEATLETWLKELSDDSSDVMGLWEMANMARGWWSYRRLDTGYLRAGPDIRCWSGEDQIAHLLWDTRQGQIDDVLSMVETRGHKHLPRPEFMQAIHSFRADLTAALLQRIEEVERLGLVNVEGGARLRVQLQKWLSDFESDLRRTPDEDWPAVLSAIRHFEPLVGPLL